MFHFILYVVSKIYQQAICRVSQHFFHVSKRIHKNIKVKWWVNFFGSVNIYLWASSLHCIRLAAVQTKILIKHCIIYMKHQFLLFRMKSANHYCMDEYLSRIFCLHTLFAYVLKIFRRFQNTMVLPQLRELGWVFSQWWYFTGRWERCLSQLYPAFSWKKIQKEP